MRQARLRLFRPRLSSTSVISWVSGPQSRSQIGHAMGDSVDLDQTNGEVYLTRLLTLSLSLRANSGRPIPTPAQGSVFRQKCKRPLLASLFCIKLRGNAGRQIEATS